MSEKASSRGAIVMSYWDWRTRNVPERLAAALGSAGWRVLYCSNPSSFLHGGNGARITLAENIEGFAPKLAGHRLNVFPPARKWQSGMLVKQVLRQARQMNIARPVVIYPHGKWVAAFARELRARGIPCVYLCIDHVEKEESEALAGAADMVLVIPQSMYHPLKACFGDKVHRIPQMGPHLPEQESTQHDAEISARWKSIPRPRLAYLGLPLDRLRSELIQTLLTAHPDWHTVTCGPVPGVNRPNLHDIGWIGPEELSAVCRQVDVGFMPYDCARDFNLHCVPLKLFDYFAAGLPVVSTPIISLWGYRDLVYLGDTADELAEGIRKALAEPPDDSRREKRRQIARAHSPDKLARLLDTLLSGVRT